MIEIFINNKKYTFEKNITILQACERANIDVPRFCYHEKLSVAGNCRMCLVEVEKSPKPVASCAMPIARGMTIYTDTPLVKKARESVLEFLLINHPLDCPICDQGGECDLQDITLNYGSDRSRFYEFKRGVEDKECGPIVKTIMTRCIHCTRCVRFLAEIVGSENLGALGRGELTEIGTYIDNFIKNELSGNLVDLCPVGALTSKPYAYSARSWELRSYDAIDCFDASGSNITVQTRSNIPSKLYKYKFAFENKDEILRILPRLNDDINENWISDKARYAFDGLKLQRLTKPLILAKSKKYLEVDWIELTFNIYNLLKNNFNQKTNSIINKKIIGISGKIIDLESMFFFYQFIKTLGSPDYLIEKNKIYWNVDAPFFYRFNSTIKNIENSDLILIIGSNPRFESSAINIKIRKQFFQKNIKIGLIGLYSDLTYPVIHLGSTTKTLIEIAEGKNNFCKLLRKAKNPLIIIGSEFSNREDAPALNNLIRFIAKKNLVYLSKWKGLSFIHSWSNSIHMCEIGATSGIRSQLHYNTKNINNNINLFVNCDLSNENFKFLTKNNSTTLNFNTHKVEKTISHIHVPTTSHFEKTNFLINLEGIVQKSYKATTPFKKAHNVEDIFKSIIKIDDIFNKYSKNINQFTNRNFLKELPWITNINEASNDFIFNYLNLKENQTKIYINNFKNIINDFYMTDIISKNSPVMSECSLFLNTKTNFIKINKQWF